jgi:hypothetical protein
MICLAVVLFLLSSAAFGDTITLVASRDDTIFKELPKNSDGAGPSLFVGTTKSAARRALLEFDIAGTLPAGAVITSVQLTLFQEQVAPAERSARMIELHRLIDDWGEGSTGRGTSPTHSGGGFNTPADGTAATWTHRFYDTVPWTNAGGDFAAAASGSTMVGTTRQAYVWASTLDMVNDVQSWLDDPADNFGWLLLGVESAASTARRFDTREATNAAVRPALEITFSGSAVPEPSAFALLSLGILCLAGYRRRRRQRTA